MNYNWGVGSSQIKLYFGGWCIRIYVRYENKKKLIKLYKQMSYGEKEVAKISNLYEFNLKKNNLSNLDDI